MRVDERHVLRPIIVTFHNHEEVDVALVAALPTAIR